MTKKNRLEGLVKLVAFSALLSASSCSATPTQDKPQKQEAATTKTIYKKDSQHALKKAQLINAWAPLAEKVEGFYPYIYECTSGAQTIGIGSEIRSVGGLENIPLRDVKGNLVGPAKKKAYARQANSSSYERSEKIAERNGIKGITKQDAYKLLYKEASEKIDKLADDMMRREKMDLFSRPLEIQILLLDLVYQKGTSGVFQGRKFWKCLRTGNLKDLHKHVVCCKNIDRNIIKRALANMAAARKEGKSLEPYLAQLNERGVPLKLNQFRSNNREILLASTQKAILYDSRLAKSEKGNLLNQDEFKPTLPLLFKMKSNNSHKG